MSLELMDLHNHTIWSDGIHTADEIIRNAIKNGVDIIGISDHFDTLKCHSVLSNILDTYIEKIDELKVKYRSKIKVMAGVEICMNKNLSRLDELPYDNLNKLDYILFEYIDWFSGSVTLPELKFYADKFTCRKGLAHTNIFELIKKYGVDEVLTILKDNDIFWEINVNPGYEYFDVIMKYRNNPKMESFFNRLKASDIRITVGSDTHSLYFYDINRIREGNELARYNISF